MKKVFGALTLAIRSVVSIAEPTGPTSKVVRIRPYIGGLAFVQLDQNSLCGTEVFKIDLSVPAGRENYAAALVAFSHNSNVNLEVSACSGWGSLVQSITISK